MRDCTFSGVTGVSNNEFDFSFLDEKDSIDKHGFGLLLGVIETLNSPMPEDDCKRKVSFVRKALARLEPRQHDLAMSHIKNNSRLLEMIIA